MKVVVLGCGKVGRVIADDLSKDDEFSVTVVDLSEKALSRFRDHSTIKTEKIDLIDPVVVKRVVDDCDIVVGAMPGFLGFRTVEAVIDAGKNMVDISFFPEDPYLLDSTAKRKGVSCLVDFGIAPGCSNLLFGHVSNSFKKVDKFLCYVGGLPVERKLPWEYQAPFSPVDVLEEYTRPARFISGGKIVTKPPLSDPELVEFPGVGTLEAFFTDGLRTLLGEKNVPLMIEKTLRYPGHRDKILLLRDSGFLDNHPIKVKGYRVTALELTSELLFSAWEQQEGDEDFTVMKVIAEGVSRDGNQIIRTWNLMDRYDCSNGITSMARTTGYTCTAAVRLLAESKWNNAGILPPEIIGRKIECFEFIMKNLKEHGVNIEPEEAIS